MVFSEAILHEIRQQTDLVELVGGYVSLKANGTRWWGLCPFHNEKSPSFTVNQSSGFFYCFGCQEKGNAFQFLMKIEHLSFSEAVKKLADRTGIIVDQTLQDDPEERDRVALFELFARLSGTFHHLLLTSPEAETARTTLLLRKISAQTITDFQLGWAPIDRTWLKKFLAKHNYQAEFLKKSGLFSQNHPDFSLFSGRIIFPIKNVSGKVVAFGGRLVGNSDGPKYLNSPETLIFQKRRTLYAFERAATPIKTSHSVHLCEGYMDALALHQSGVTTAVAPLGTSFTEEHAKLLQRYTNNVVCIFDSDEAGKKATLRTIETFLPLDIEPRVVVIQNGKDPAEILQNEGDEAVRGIVLDTVRGFDFLLDFYYNFYNNGTNFDWGGFSKVIFSILHRIGSQVRQETLLKSVAERLRVSEESLAKDFRSGTLTQPDKRNQERVGTKRKSEEWIFLLTLVANSHHFQWVRGELSVDDFLEIRARELFEILCELNDRNLSNVFSIDEVLEKSQKRSWEAELSQGLATGDFALQAEQVLEDGLGRLKLRRLRTRRSEIQVQLNSATMAFVAKQPLLVEVKFLNHEIARWERKN